MAPIERKQPLLSICIPIYNRIAFLERQLERMLEDRFLFEEQIQLIISDNCSTDNLQSCCEKYQALGLALKYHRQVTNIGPDGNFEWCFYHADGKYVWLLGSDDILVRGVLKKLVMYLADDEYGLVHLSMNKQLHELTVFQSPNDMAVAVNYWITYMSANIIRTASLVKVVLSEYKDSFLIQVPAYLNACCSYQRNALICFPLYFEKDADNANNGGYNLFQVFVANLYGIFEMFVNRGLLSQESFEKVIEVEYKGFLSRYIINLLIFRRYKNFNTEGALKILWKYYGKKAYAYYYPVYFFIKQSAWHIIHFLLISIGVLTRCDCIKWFWFVWRKCKKQLFKN